MTLAEFRAKYEGVLLSAPMLASAIVDLIQDERADEREQCAQVADEYKPAYHNTAHHIAQFIRNRTTEESN